MSELIIRAHEFASPGIVEVGAGQTLRQMLLQASGGRELAECLVVRIGGAEVPEVLWDRVRPKAGTQIRVTRMALAGGDSWKQILGAALMIVVSIYAPGWGQAIAGSMGWGATAAQAISAGIMIAASYAVNTLVRVPVAEVGDSSQKSWNQLTGSSNQINPWGVIPLVIGEHRFFPTHGAMPYTTMVGYSSFQHCLFDVGYGSLEVGQFRIGDTPIESYQDWFVQYVPTGVGATVYANDVTENPVQSQMNDDGDTAMRTTAPNTDSIGVDILFAQGLKVIDQQDTGWPMWVMFRVQYRPVGTTTWLNPSNERLSMLAKTWTPGGFNLPGVPPSPGYYMVRQQTTDPFASGVAWDVPPGQYEVQVTRVDTQWEDGEQPWVDSAMWLVLRSIRYANPSTTGTFKLATRIRATDQLNGTLQSFSAFARQNIAVYDRGAGTWSMQYSTNPAWVAYWLLTTCPAVARKVTADRIDLDSFADFAEHCDAHGLRARMVHDVAMPLFELVRKVLGAGLGDLGRRDGRYGVVFDRNDPVPTMVFTPMETRNFRMQRPFVQIPDALRVQFVNPLADWQEDEIIVVRDGFSWRGTNARGAASEAPEATRFETMKLQQTMDPSQAWQIARYHFAQALFRNAGYEWESDIAGLSVTRGDCVQVPNDVTEWGTGWGRVIRIEAGGIDGAAATVTLDNAITTEAGTSYRMQFRSATGALVIASLVAAGGETETFAIDAMPAGIASGDVAVIGETAVEMRTVIVTGVRYNADLATMFTGCDYDDRVAPYWADAPEDIVSEVSGRNYGDPAPPRVDIVVSDPANDAYDDAGIPTSIVHVPVHPRGGYEEVFPVAIQ